MRRLSRYTAVKALVPVGLLIGLLALRAVLGGAMAAPTGHVERCAPRPVPLPVVGYDLGARFDGLALADRSTVCFPGSAEGPRSIPVASRIYGTCTNDSFEGGCGPPLEIQSWPLCARHPSGAPSTHGSWLERLVSRLTPGLGQLAPDLLRQLPSLAAAHPRLPTGVTAELARMPVSPTAGQIELYTPDTTIVVFADAGIARHPHLGDDAAAVLAVEAVLNARRSFPRGRIPWPTRAAGCA